VTRADAPWQVTAEAIDKAMRTLGDPNQNESLAVRAMRLDLSGPPPRKRLALSIQAL
jgi:hypothetical protein